MRTYMSFLHAWLIRLVCVCVCVHVAHSLVRGRGLGSGVKDEAVGLQFT